MWVAGSRDLQHDHADLVVEGCFFECSTHDESYDFGGTELSGGLGIGFAGDGF